MVSNVCSYSCNPIVWTRTAVSRVGSLFTYAPVQQNVPELVGRVSRDPAYRLNATEVEQILRDLSEQPLSAEQILKLIKSLSESQLLALAGIEKEKVAEVCSAQAEIKSLAVAGVLGTKGKAIWREVFPEIKHFIYHILEMLINITGINQIGGHSQYEGEASAYEAEMKLRFYIQMLGYPSTIFGVAYAFVGTAAAAAVIAAATITSTLLFITIYARYFRPCPKEHPGLENITIKVLREKENPLFHRTDIFGKIYSAFESRKGVFVVAEPGIGKSSLVRSLAETIALGNCPEYLKPTQVMGANACNLTTVGDGTSFRQIENRFDRYEDKVVFFLDEIHSLFEVNGIEGKKTNNILTFLDKFPYVIIATTTKHFEDLAMAQDKPFMRRFELIKIGPLKPRELELSLEEHFHKKAPELQLDEGIISYIMEKALLDRNTSQVHASHSLLTKAISCAKSVSFQELEASIHELEQEIRFMQLELLHNESGFDAKIYYQKKNELQELQQVLATRKEHLKRIKKVEEVYLKYKRNEYVLAAKAKKNGHTKWLQNKILVKVLSRHIEHERRKAGLPVKINRALIDKILI